MIDIWILRIFPQKKFYNIDHLCCWTLRGKIEGKKLTFSDFCCSIRAESAFISSFLSFSEIWKEAVEVVFASDQEITSGRWKTLKKWTKVRPELFFRCDATGSGFMSSVFPCFRNAFEDLRPVKLLQAWRISPLLLKNCRNVSNKLISVGQGWKFSWKTSLLFFLS